MGAAAAAKLRTASTWEGAGQDAQLLCTRALLAETPAIAKQLSSSTPGSFNYLLWTWLHSCTHAMPKGRVLREMVTPLR